MRKASPRAPSPLVGEGGLRRQPKVGPSPRQSGFGRAGGRGGLNVRRHPPLPPLAQAQGAPSPTRGRAGCPSCDRLVRSHCIDRNRADRLVDRARRARARARERDRRAEPQRFHNGGGGAVEARRPLYDERRRGGEGCRPRRDLDTSGRLCGGGGGDRAGAEAGRDPHRCRLGQALGHPAGHAPPSGACAFRSGASGGGHRALGSRRGLRRALPQSLVHPDAAGGDGPRGDRTGARPSGRRSARTSRRWRPTTTTWCSPSPAMCRI